MDIEIVTNPQGMALVNIEPFRKQGGTDRLTLERFMGGEVFYRCMDKKGNWWIEKNLAANFFRQMGWQVPNGL